MGVLGGVLEKGGELWGVAGSGAVKSGGIPGLVSAQNNLCA